MSSSNDNKKLKKDDLDRQKQEIEILRKHILSCKDLSSSSCAMKAALSGLDKELQRVNRDQKLKEKFSKSKNEVDRKDFDDPESCVVDWKNEKNTNNNVKSDRVDDSILMEWQDVHSPSPEPAPGSTFEESILGKKLTEEAISKIANADAKVSDELSAVAVAIHSALLSDLLNFKCTGVPELNNDDSSSNGFAKPIRELPKHQFLPDEFHSRKDRNLVQLRYRKKETGAVLLKLSLITTSDETNISIEFSSTVNQPEPNPQGPISFPLTDHFNLDSFNTALDSAQKRSKFAKILPTLHFKRLSILLTNFVSTFDVGPVNGPTLELKTRDNIRVENSISNTKMSPLTNLSTGSEPINTRYDNQGNPDYYTMQDFNRPRMQGDFDQDLLPGGNPILQPAFDLNTGSLMGPNHPMFRDHHGDLEDDYGMNDPLRPAFGGLGMRPRFDPYGPPGGPTDTRRNGGRGRGGRNANRGRGRGMFGEPNPDHQRPPNNLGGNMFM